MAHDDEHGHPNNLHAPAASHTRHHLHIPHPHLRPHSHHGAEPHDDHFHPVRHRPTHTVIHAVRTNSGHVPHVHDRTHTRKHMISRPSARQFFDSNGDLHKICDIGVPRVAGKFELFLDLLYIGLCANFAEDCIHHPTDPNYLLKYLLIFVPAWRIWVLLTNIFNLYYNDDFAQRTLIVWIMSLMMLYGNNAIYIDKDLQALQISAAAFLLARGTLAVVNLCYSLTVPHHAMQLRAYNILALLILPLWTPVFLPGASNVTKIFVAIVAFSLDLLANYITWSHWFLSHFKLEYYTAVDIEHHIDRMSAFFILVLGEFLYGLVWASPCALSVDNYVRAVLSLVIAFALCWLYCAADGSHENLETGVHALRWKRTNGTLWFLLHLPLSASLLIAGDICAVFVKYGGDGSYLAKRAEEGGAKTFPAYDDFQALRWLFCGGLAVGVAMLYAICLLHHEADADEDTKCLLFFPVWLRRIWRAPVAVVIACLPLTDQLNITEMMGICTALLFGVVMWEMVGGMDRSWRWIESKKVICEDGTMKVLESTESESEKGHASVVEREHGRDNDMSAEMEIFENVRDLRAARPGEDEHGMIKY